jgi:hypothetical protein
VGKGEETKGDRDKEAEYEDKDKEAFTFQAGNKLKALYNISNETRVLYLRC